MAEYVHSVLPPKAALEKWEQLYFSNEENLDVLLIEAYQAGADHELNECCEWQRLHLHSGSQLSKQLRNERRPKPLSVKEKAILAIDTAVADGRLSQVVANVVREALDLIKEE